MRIKLENFKGMIPRVQPRLLPAGYAQTAENVMLDTGLISPLRETETVYTFDAARDVFTRFNDAWYGWQGEGISAVPGPVAQNRLYVTGDGAPKLLYQGDFYPLALEAPASAPTVAFTNKPADPTPDDPDDPVTEPTTGGTTPAALQILRQPVGSISGYVLQTQPAIAIVDAAGLLCAGDNTTEVTVAISEGTMGALLGTRVETAVNGIVRFTDLNLTGDVDTDYRLSFTSGDLTEAESDIVLVTENYDDVTSSVVFAYTFVTSLGEESAPSPLSDALDFYPGLIVRLSNFEAAPAGRLIDKMRLYRSVTSLAGVTDLYFVAEVAATTLTHDHDLEVEPIVEVLPSADFDTPPDDMEGIIGLPNGMMAAFAGREVLFCEPYKPHAWPTKYRLTTDFDIVGLAAFGSTIAVLTVAVPYVVTGSHPETMVMERLEVNYPCLSRRGIVDLGYSIAYPSTDGLVTLGQAGAQLVTRKALTRDQWRSMAPTSFIAAQSEGRYVVSHQSASATDKDTVDWVLFGIWDDGLTPAEAAAMSDSRRVTIFDLTGDAPFLWQTDEDLASLFLDVEDGQLYVIEADAPTEIRAWHSGDPKSFTWRSGVARTGYPTNFGAIEIRTDAAAGTSLTTRLYADGSLVATITDRNTPARLPGGFLATEWAVEMSGTDTVNAVLIANTVEELLND